MRRGPAFRNREISPEPASLPEAGMTGKADGRRFVTVRSILAQRNSRCRPALRTGRKRRHRRCAGRLILGDFVDFTMDIRFLDDAPGHAATPRPFARDHALLARMVLDLAAENARPHKTAAALRTVISGAKSKTEAQGPVQNSRGTINPSTLGPPMASPTSERQKKSPHYCTVQDIFVSNSRIF